MVIRIHYLTTVYNPTHVAHLYPAVASYIHHVANFETASELKHSPCIDKDLGACISLAAPMKHHDTPQGYFRLASLTRRGRRMRTVVFHHAPAAFASHHDTSPRFYEFRASVYRYRQPHCILKVDTPEIEV